MGAVKENKGGGKLTVYTVSRQRERRPLVGW
jgi:hypothetical protein